MTKVDTIIVAAGSGARLGHKTPKAFVNLCGKPLIYYSLSAFVSHASIDKIILVAPADLIDYTQSIINEYPQFKEKIKITAGGDERYKSVQNGVAQSSAEWVLIHDAARPFVSADVINSILNMRDEFDCAITATPVVDTIRELVSDNVCGKTLDRSKLMRVGTPQMFKREMLVKAFDEIKNMQNIPTDEAALFENLGIKIGYSWGSALNFKITTQEDFDMAQALIEKNLR